MEFLFSFFSLLLGLAATNVAAGFADMWRGRDEAEVGILPPLLGLFILLAVAHDWIIFWKLQATLSMGAWQMLAGMTRALPYIFVSTAMYPRRPESWPSLEAYCLSNNRVLMGVLAVPPLVSMVYSLTLTKQDPLSVVALQGPLFLIPVVLAGWQSIWPQRIGTGLLCAVMTFTIF